MRKGAALRVLIGLCVILAAVLLVLATGGDNTEVTTDGEVITHTVTAADAGKSADETAAAPDGDGGPAPETGTPEPTPLRDATVKRREEDAPTDYFDDAAFVGNEQIMALGMYDYDGLLTNANFYETDSLTETGWLYDLDEEADYGKIYLGVGASELNYNDETLRRGIQSAASSLRERYPDAIFYLMGVPPVSAYKSSVSSVYNKDRVLYFNEMLQRLAAEEGMGYVDVYGAVSDEEGFLPSEVTVDGVNFTPGQYAGWYELLAGNYLGAEP